MSNYSTLITSIQDNIKQNGRNLITGELLQQVLLSMIAELGAEFQFVGVAVPTDNPGTPDYNIAYIAGPGVYPNFGATNVPGGYVGVFKYNGEWAYNTFRLVEIVNGLSGGTDKALSAQQGVVLNNAIQDVDSAAISRDATLGGRIDAQNAEISQFEEAVQEMVNEYPMVTIEGNVTNAPDGEDLTTEDDKLKFANRSALFGKGYVILRRGKTFAEQVTLQNTIYEIRYDFDLGGAAVTVPAGCVLNFVGGSLFNGAIVFDGTQLINPRMNVRFSGSLANNEMSLSANTGDVHSNFIADVMNLDNPVTLILDKDITLSRGTASVKRLLLKSDGKRRTITNADKFEITTTSGVRVEQVSFVFSSGTQNAVDYTDGIIYIGNADALSGDLPVCFHGVNVSADFRKNYVLKIRPQSTNAPVMRVCLDVDSCNFSGLIVGVADIRTGCYGRVISTMCAGNGNTIVADGRREPSCAFRLGYDYVEADESVMANDVLFDKCSFEQQVGGYMTGNDVGELHFILLYGNRNTIRNCNISTLSSSFAQMQDAGSDAEGIYIKGSSCEIYGNKIQDASGKSADGMINLKAQNYHDNIVSENSIIITTAFCPIIFHIGGVRNAVRNNIVKQVSTAVDADIPFIFYLPPNSNTQICGNEISVKVCARFFIGANSNVVIRSNDITMDCPENYSASLVGSIIFAAATITSIVIGNVFHLRNIVATGALFAPSKMMRDNAFFLDGITSTRDLFNFQYSPGIFADNEVTINNCTFRRLGYKAAQTVQFVGNVIGISSNDSGINAALFGNASAAPFDASDVIANNVVRGYKAFTFPADASVQNNFVVTLTS